MIIKDLKDKYPLVYEEILKEQERQGNTKNDSLDLIAGVTEGNFNWKDAKLPINFWIHIDDSEFDDAKKLHPELFEEPSSTWTPKVGDYAYMTYAGGWGYSPENNGRVAKITALKEYNLGNDNYVLDISGEVINPNANTVVTFNCVPIQNRRGEAVFRKATDEEVSNAKGEDLKEGYFPDLSEHIGRYLQALVNNPFGGKDGVRKGDYGKIVDKKHVDFPYFPGYSCTKALEEDYLNVKFKLMPEGFVPPGEKVEEKKDFWEGVEYVECLRDCAPGIEFTKGKVYAVKSRDAEILSIAKDDKGSTTNAWGLKFFKPSTKEAYDAQNTPKSVVATNRDFTDCKIRVNSPKESELVQKKLFKLGFSWSGMKNIAFTYRTYLYLKENLSLSFGDDDSIFKTSEKREITLSDLGIFDIAAPNEIIDSGWLTTSAHLGDFPGYIKRIDPYYYGELLTPKETFKIPTTGLPEIVLRKSHKTKTKSSSKRLNLKIN